MLDRVSEVTIFPRGVSDHALVCSKLRFGVPGERLSKYWIEGPAVLYLIIQILLT